MKISDYYAGSLLRPLRYTQKVYPIIAIEKDMSESHKDKGQKGKRVSRAFPSGSQKIPKENSNVKSHNGVGVYLSIWV